MAANRPYGEFYDFYSISPGTTSRVMAANRPYGEFYNFSASVQNIYDTTSYKPTALCNEVSCVHYEVRT
jgi:hypothetical protein